MKNRSIYITEQDMKRLRELIETEKGLNFAERSDLQVLAAELDRARLLAPSDVPEDVVTMNSKVELVDLDTGLETTYTLVFPDKADIDQNKISVLAPIGTAILGYRTGDIFEWEVPEGSRRLKIKNILYQPESAGD
jgi:regulator of nucleoside diphosphate kinase